MSQSEVKTFLLKVKELYVSAYDIAKKIDLSVISVRRALNSMLSHGEVEFITAPKSKLRLWRLKEEKGKQDGIS